MCMPAFICGRRGCSTTSRFGNFNTKTEQLDINCMGNWKGFLADLEHGAKRFRGRPSKLHIFLI